MRRFGTPLPCTTRREPCPRCRGRGAHPIPGRPLMSAVVWERCGECDGTGMIVVRDWWAGRWRDVR